MSSINLSPEAQAIILDRGIELIVKMIAARKNRPLEGLTEAQVLAGLDELERDFVTTDELVQRAREGGNAP